MDGILQRALQQAPARDVPEQQEDEVAERGRKLLAHALMCKPDVRPCIAPASCQHARDALWRTLSIDHREEAQASSTRWLLLVGISFALQLDNSPPAHLIAGVPAHVHLSAMEAVEQGAIERARERPDEPEAPRQTTVDWLAHWLIRGLVDCLQGAPLLMHLPQPGDPNSASVSPAAAVAQQHGSIGAADSQQPATSQPASASAVAPVAGTQTSAGSGWDARVAVPASDRPPPETQTAADVHNVYRPPGMAGLGSLQGSGAGVSGLAGPAAVALGHLQQVSAASGPSPLAGSESRQVPGGLQLQGAPTPATGPSTSAATNPAEVAPALPPQQAPTASQVPVADIADPVAAAAGPAPSAVAHAQGVPEHAVPVDLAARMAAALEALQAGPIEDDEELMLVDPRRAWQHLLMCSNHHCGYAICRSGRCLMLHRLSCNELHHPPPRQCGLCRRVCTHLLVGEQAGPMQVPMEAQGEAQGPNEPAGDHSQGGPSSPRSGAAGGRRPLAREEEGVSQVSGVRDIGRRSGTGGAVHDGATSQVSRGQGTAAGTQGASQGGVSGGEGVGGHEGPIGDGSQTGRRGRGRSRGPADGEGPGGAVLAGGEAQGPRGLDDGEVEGVASGASRGPSPLPKRRRTTHSDGGAGSAPEGQEERMEGGEGAEEGNAKEGGTGAQQR